MEYIKMFDPNAKQLPGFEVLSKHTKSLGDTRDGSVYVYTEPIVLGVNVALVTGRPLLLRGPTGSGKSSLARNVARHLGWRYYEHVISSRTQARDLLWTFDAVRRLSDAQAQQLRPPAAYVRPGVLWWSFDRESAFKRGLSSEDADRFNILDPGVGSDHERAVVLLDEIDKADPDVPNDLLVPLGSLEFLVEETEVEISVKAKGIPLVVITTNDERELPTAFLRRCVMLTLDSPDEKRLMEIAKAHGGPAYAELSQELAKRITQLKEAPADFRPSTAEFLDALRVCVELGVGPKSDKSVWQHTLNVTIWKPRDIQKNIR